MSQDKKMNFLLFREDGFALLTVTALAGLLFGIAVPYFNLLGAEKKMIRASENALKAELLAEAGMEEVMWEYSYGGADFAGADGWSGTTTKTKTVNSFTNTSGTTVGSYTTSVANWSSSSPVITTTSTASGDGTARQATLKSGLTTRPMFTSAIKAKSTVHLDSNAFTDSYNSTSGVYGGSNRFSNGDVTTNSTAAPAVTLDSNAQIRGDAGTGTGGAVSPTSRVTGTVSSSVNESFTSNTVPSYLTSASYSGVINNDFTLPSGNYRYDRIDLGSNKTVTIAGNVELYLENSSTALSLDSNSVISMNAGSTLTLYVNGNVQIDSNGGINMMSTTNISSVKIYGTANCTSFSMDSNTRIGGSISAPDADFQIDSNASIYGAVIGDSFEIDSNAAVHYDENLGVNGPGTGYKLKWARRV